MYWCSFTWTLLAMGAVSGPMAAASPLDVRVGLLAYEDFRAELRDYDRLFTALSRSSARPVRFRLAAGTYADVLHWLDRGQIDVALVTSGVVARECAAGQDRSGQPRCQYLATMLRPPARTPWPSMIAAKRGDTTVIARCVSSLQTRPCTVSTICGRPLTAGGRNCSLSIRCPFPAGSQRSTP